MTGSYPAPIFSLANQRNAIEAELLTLPEGDKGAFVAVATLDGVQVAVTARFGEHWRVVGVLRVIPMGLRDRLYEFIARNRFRIAGRQEACYVPPPGFRERFLG